MVFPLKQYRRLLLLSVYLCTTTLLFISVIRVFTALDSTPTNQSSFSTFALGASMPYLTGGRRSGFERVKSLDPSGTQGFDARTVPLTTNRSQTISLNVAGSTQIALNHPAIYVASILSPTPSGGTAIYPVRYEWFLDQHPSALTYRSNGITSTATITWSTAGIRVIGVSASTGIGEVAAPYTISVSALSPQLTSNQTTTFAYNESIGTGILIQIPAQALDRSVQMAYLPLGTVSAPQPKGYLGQAFQLNVQENGTNLDSFSF